MSIGFGSSTQTCKQFARNQIKQRKYLGSAGFIQDLRTEWVNGRDDWKLDATEKELLNPPQRDLNIGKAKLMPNYRRTSSVCGLWELTLFEFNNSCHNDFQIQVCLDDAGNNNFHPDNIQTAITKKYGYSTYLKWKQLVLNDFDSLRKLISAVRSNITHPYQSVTCCRRSNNLCMNAGLTVINNIAFLLPARFKD